MIRYRLEVEYDQMKVSRSQYATRATGETENQVMLVLQGECAGFPVLATILAAAAKTLEAKQP